MLILAFLGLGEQYALILPILYFQGMFPILSEPVRHVFLFIFLFAHSAVALWIGIDHLRVSISTWLRCFVTRQSSSDENAASKSDAKATITLSAVGAL